jgi:hypothetical protein
MFELRPNVSDEHVLAHARRARAEGWFQLFAPHVGERTPEDEEFEAARLVDLLEGEGWAFTNAAYSAEFDYGSAYDWGPYGFLASKTVVGTIYTFRRSDSPPDWEVFTRSRA